MKMNSIAKLINHKLKNSNIHYEQDPFKGEGDKYHFLYVSINKLSEPVGISYECELPRSFSFCGFLGLISIIKVNDNAATAARLIRDERYDSLSSGVVGSHRRCYRFYWRYIDNETKETEN